MEDLPANLDDGELWLPSDIFPAEEPLHHRRPIPSGRLRSEDLARQFNSLNILDHRRRILSSKAPPISQGLEVQGPMRQYAISAPSPNGCYGQKVGPTVDHGLRRCDYDYDYDYESEQYLIPAGVAPCQPLRYPIHKPHHHHHLGAEAEQLMGTRIATTRRVQNRHQNRLFPFQGTAFGFGFGCFMKDCRGIGTAAGTGVFIPRATTPHKTTTCDGGQRKLGVTPQRGSGKKLGMDNAEEYYSFDPQVPSSHVGLPKDWTY